MTKTWQLDAFGPRGAYRTRNQMPVTDVTGTVLAEMSMVPSLFITRTAATLRKAAPLPIEERAAAIRRAASAFGSGSVAGMTTPDFQFAVARSGGSPLPVVRRATASVAERLSMVHRSVLRARPAGAAGRWDDPSTGGGRAVWQRRGEVFAAGTAGNHPGSHSLWPEALALGYRVLVRPSRREPFTPYRLVLALWEAGFSPDQVAFLPTDHDRADLLLRSADRSIVYGGDEVVAKYAGLPAVLPQGPGRAKVLITAEMDWRDHLDTIVDSVSSEGGTGCVNATGVLFEGDPTPLCAAIAERLAVLPALPPDHEDAVLPVQPIAAVRAIQQYLRTKAASGRVWLDDIVGDLGDGSAALRPSVHQLDSPNAPQLTVELPFPCVWVAPWDRHVGLTPLRHSLVVTVLSTDTALIDALVAEPTISNVHIGDHPTVRMAAGLPHDGYLAEFLMQSKTIFRD